MLRPFTDADIDQMGPILADPELLRLTGSVHTSAQANTQSASLDEGVLHWYRTRAEQPDRLDLAIIDRDRNTCVGEVVLNELSEADDTCNYRVLIGPAGRDRGLGSRATRLLIDYAFSHTRLQRIGLEVYAFNPRAHRVYERAGFILEGRKRAEFTFDGERIDTLVMGQLRSDWESARFHPKEESLPRWTDPPRPAARLPWAHD